MKTNSSLTVLQSHRLIVFISLFLVAFFVRLMLLPHPGFEADISFWKSWGLAPFDMGMVKAAHVTNNNYPTPFSYLLWFLVWVYSWFADPHNFNEFWSNTNSLFLTIVKLPTVLADLGISAFIFWFGKQTKRFGLSESSFMLYPLLSLLYLASPISIIDGAWWGQVDSLGVFIFLLALASIISKRPMLAGLLYMLALMTKLQNMIYGPLFFLLVWQLEGYRGLIQSLAGAVISFFGLNIEFFLARDMGRVIASLTENYDYFPWMSLNAFNLWWIVSGAHGMKVSDKLLSIGILNAKSLGLYTFASFYLMAVLHMITVRIKRTVNIDRSTILFHFFVSLIIVNASFFLFQTQSHDRYIFPLSVFLLLLTPFLRPVAQKLWLIGYGVWSMVYFYNLNTAMVFNYPNNGVPILSNIAHPFFTIITSILLIGLFFAYLWFIRHELQWKTIIIPFFILLGAILMANIPLIIKKPISLTKLTPFTWRQEYSKLMTNMPTNANVGFPKWSPLSVQYAFYRKGLGTHANSVIEYDLNRLFSRLTTDYGIDTQAGGSGTATFELYGDGKVLFKSEKIGRYDMPRHVSVDVTGVKTLGLVTTDAGDGRNDDHTDWLNPILYTN